MTALIICAGSAAAPSARLATVRLAAKAAIGRALNKDAAGKARRCIGCGSFRVARLVHSWVAPVQRAEKTTDSPWYGSGRGGVWAYASAWVA